LYICGRRKDLIIVGGRNYYPQDIELDVESAHPKIRPGCIIAFEVEVDDESAIVILAELRDPKDIKKTEYEPIASAIYRLVLTTYNLFCHAVVLLEPHKIPKTTSGKVQRQPAKKAFLDKSLKTLYIKYYDAKAPKAPGAAAEDSAEAPGAAAEDSTEGEAESSEEPAVPESAVTPSKSSSSSQASSSSSAPTEQTSEKDSVDSPRTGGFSLSRKFASLLGKK